jgi:hypothetical protein
MTPCSPLSFNGRFGGTYHLHLQIIPEDYTLHNHSCENLKSYIYEVCLMPNFVLILYLVPGILLIFLF